MITGSVLGSIIILLGGDSNIVRACTIVLLSGILSMIVAVMVYRINSNAETA